MKPQGPFDRSAAVIMHDRGVGGNRLRSIAARPKRWIVRRIQSAVMAGLDPAIHVLRAAKTDVAESALVSARS
jgi:hypothetical protein